MSVLDKFVSKEATLSMPITTYQVLLEQAALEERKRIIKLLEPLVACEACATGDVADDCSAKSYAYAIELIKGETK